MPVDPIDIAVLSSPITMPGETGTIAPSSFGTSTQQNIQAMTRGSGVTSPIGTGNTMTPMPFPPITGAALESGGANVGGVVQQAPKEDLETKLEFASLEDQKIAAVEKEQEEQANEFMKAYEEGVSGNRDITNRKKTGMKGARTAKRQDRRADREARKDAGLKGSEKRAMRRAQRRSRRAAFKDFKGERDYQASLEAAQL